MAVQPGLCRTWSETPKTGFLRMRLDCFSDRFEIEVDFSDSVDIPLLSDTADNITELTDNTTIADDCAV